MIFTDNFTIKDLIKNIKDNTLIITKEDLCLFNFLKFTEFMKYDLSFISYINLCKIKGHDYYTKSLEKIINKNMNNDYDAFIYCGLLFLMMKPTKIKNIGMLYKVEGLLYCAFLLSNYNFDVDYIKTKKLYNDLFNQRIRNYNLIHKIGGGGKKKKSEKKKEESKITIENWETVIKTIIELILYLRENYIQLYKYDKNPIQFIFNEILIPFTTPKKSNESYAGGGCNKLKCLCKTQKYQQKGCICMCNKNDSLYIVDEEKKDNDENDENDEEEEKEEKKKEEREEEKEETEEDKIILKKLKIIIDITFPNTLKIENISEPIKQNINLIIEIIISIFIHKLPEQISEEDIQLHKLTENINFMINSKLVDDTQIEKKKKIIFEIILIIINFVNSTIDFIKDTNRNLDKYKKDNKKRIINILNLIKNLVKIYMKQQFGEEKKKSKE